MKKLLLICALHGALQNASAEPSGIGVTAVSFGKEAKSSAGVVVLASHARAALNSHLLTGGGTDDTAALQAVLDRAADGTPVHLVIDGVALVGGLNVYGNTTIECLDGAGLYLKDSSSRAIIRNVHRSRGSITDEHITVRGCFLNGNRERQPSADISRGDLPDYRGPSNREADGTFISGLQFLGVNYLTIEKVTLWNVRAFGALIGNASRIHIENVVIDHGSPPDADIGNTDGLHFKGPLRYLTIDGIKLRTGDDALAFNADDFETDDLTIRNDFGPYVTQGPITDVSVNNVQFMDAALGIRLLSSVDRIDRVTINNVTGTVYNYAVTISHWVNPTSFGNIGAILLNNINVDRPKADTALILKEIAKSKESAKTPLDEGLSKEFNEGMIPLFSINGNVEHLGLHNVVARVSDDRPVLRIGPDAHIRTMTAELSLQDPEFQSVPVELDKGGHVECLNLSVHWEGDSADRGKNPIAARGGTVARLHWVDTPPLFVDGTLVAGNAVSVTLSQDVKAADFKAGVRIKVNGKPVSIARVHRSPGHADTVGYVLTRRFRPSDTVTWAYDAADGSIQNWSGGQLLSVSEKSVGNRR